MVVDEITKTVSKVDQAANFLLYTILFILLHVSNIIVFFTLDSTNPIMTTLKWGIILSSIIIMILFLFYGNRKSNEEKRGQYTGILFTSIVVYIAIWILIMLFSPELIKMFKLKMEEYMY
jgi:hypothetical protein